MKHILKSKMTYIGFVITFILAIAHNNLMYSFYWDEERVIFWSFSSLLLFFISWYIFRNATDRIWITLRVSLPFIFSCIVMKMAGFSFTDSCDFEVISMDFSFFIMYIEVGINIFWNKEK